MRLSDSNVETGYIMYSYGPFFLKFPNLNIIIMGI